VAEIANLPSVSPSCLAGICVSNYRDAHLASHFSQRTVAREEGGVERFSKSKVSGIVSGQSVAHLPHAREKDEMRIACEWKIDEIV
jgi:hypothetical protein